MASKSKHLSIEEASEYWDRHSVADYPSRVVEIEYSPEEFSTSVVMESDEKLPA